MAKLRRVGILFLAKLLATIMGAAGLIAGILYAFGGLIYDIFTTGFNRGTILAFGALIGMPVIFALAGFVAGALGAILYNVSTGWFQGIETDFEKRD